MTKTITKRMAIILIVLFLCGIGLTLTACDNYNDKEERYRIELIVIDPKTGEPFEGHSMDVKREDFNGLEIKYRLEGEKNIYLIKI